MSNKQTCLLKTTSTHCPNESYSLGLGLMILPKVSRSNFQTLTLDMVNSSHQFTLDVVEGEC